MKNAVEVGSGAMIYIHTKFLKGWFKHSKVDRGDTQTGRRAHYSVFIFSK
jgi:hypothetical protein